MCSVPTSHAEAVATIRGRITITANTGPESIRATTTAGVPTTDTIPRTITGLPITAGRTTHGPRRLPMDGAGADRPGTATTAAISRHIPSILQRHSG